MRWSRTRSFHLCFFVVRSTSVRDKPVSPRFSTVLAAETREVDMLLSQFKHESVGLAHSYGTEIRCCKGAFMSWLV